MSNIERPPMGAQAPTAAGDPAARPAPAGPPSRSRARRALGWIGRVLLGILVVLVLVLASLWWWAGTEGSLATTLSRAAGLLPPDQVLSSRDVTGSVRAGGHIGQLRYESPTLAVEVDDVAVGWQLAPLLHRAFKLGELHARKVTLTPRTPAEPPPVKSADPLTQLTLPLDIDLPFKVDELVWVGASETVARNLAGRYRYTSDHHLLDLEGVDVLGGHYSATAKLQGPAPMALQAALQARVEAPMPEGAAPLTVLANATVDGTLSGSAARLQVSAKANSEAGVPNATAVASVANGAVAGSAAETAKVLRATVQAAIAPWAPQPVISAEAALSHLDAARLMPGAPRTDISGTVHAGPLPGSSVPSGPTTTPTTPATPTAPPGTPLTSPAPPLSSAPRAETVWQATIALVNADAGPYDTQRLPLERIDAEARFDGRAWTVPKAHLELAGGTIDAEGRWAPTPDPWQARVTLDHINPAQLHTALDAAPLGGTARATQAGEVIAFALDLGAQQRKGAAAPASSGDKLRLDRAVVEGSLTGGKALEVPVLRIEAERARVQGKLSAQLDKQSGQGNLEVTLPGASAKINADIAPETGNAKIDAALADAAQLQRWIEKLPGLGGVFAGSSLDGAAQLDARWQGGWKTAQRQMESGKPEAGKPLRLDATLTSSKLDIRLAPAAAAATGKAAAQAAAAVANAATGLPAPPAGTVAEAATTPKPAPQTIALRDFRLALAGTPAAATLDLKGQAKLGSQQLMLATHAQGGIIGPDRWRVGIEKLRLDAKDTTATSRSPWTVQLVDPLDLTVRRAKPDSGGSAARLIVDTSAGRATLQGPAPGTARIAWQPVHFEQTAPATGSNRPAFLLQSKGTLRDLPMGWAQALASTGTDNSGGVTGDLVFEGDWDIDVGAQLRADLRLARSRGDLRVLVGGAAVVRRIDSTGTGSASEVKTDAGGSDSPSTPAGLRVAEVTVKATGNDVRARLRWDSARAGTINAEATTRLTAQDGGWTLAPDAPLDGQIKAAVPDIGVWAVLAPPGWRIQGTLAADVALAGTLDAPKWRGTLTADQLSVKAAVEGIDLRNGRLRATLTGDRLQLDELRLEGGPANGARIGGQSGNISTVASEKAEGGGSLTATGSVEWGSGAKPADSTMTAALDVDIKRLRVLARTDRQASISGQLQIGMRQGQVKVRGKLRTDRASIILPDGTAPSLDSDVVVTSAALRREKAAKDAKVAKAQASAAQADADETAARASTPKPMAAKPPDVDVTFNLGDDFALQGQGITTRLEGELEIRSNASTGGQPRIFGEVRTVQGQYRAYGQELNVEKGVVRFNGPMTNPALDMLAVRPNIDVRAGVRITGSAQSPRVSLYSDPPLPDAEALSWVVLGRSAASGGAEALVMQQAALALIGGLAPGGKQGNFASRLGLDEIGFKGPGDGEGASGAAITLGKRISKNIYLSYERSLSGTLGTLFVFYELTKRLKLRAEAGTQSGLDIIYTISFD